VGHLQSISVHVRHELLTPLHKQFSIIEVAYYILYLRHKRWWYSQSYLSFPFFHGFFSLVRSGNAIFLCKWNPCFKGSLSFASSSEVETSNAERCYLLGQHQKKKKPNYYVLYMLSLSLRALKSLAYRLI